MPATNKRFPEFKKGDPIPHGWANDLSRQVDNLSGMGDGLNTLTTAAGKFNRDNPVPVVVAEVELLETLEASSGDGVTETTAKARIYGGVGASWRLSGRQIRVTNRDDDFSASIGSRLQVVWLRDSKEWRPIRSGASEESDGGGTAAITTCGCKRFLSRVLATRDSGDYTEILDVAHEAYYFRAPNDLTGSGLASGRDPVGTYYVDPYDFPDNVFLEFDETDDLWASQPFDMTCPSHVTGTGSGTAPVTGEYRWELTLDSRTNEFSQTFQTARLRVVHTPGTGTGVGTDCGYVFEAYCEDFNPMAESEFRIVRPSVQCFQLRDCIICMAPAMENGLIDLEGGCDDYCEENTQAPAICNLGWDGLTTIQGGGAFPECNATEAEEVFELPHTGIGCFHWGKTFNNGTRKYLVMVNGVSGALTGAGGGFFSGNDGLVNESTWVYKVYVFRCGIEWIYEYVSDQPNGWDGTRYTICPTFEVVDVPFSATNGGDTFWVQCASCEVTDYPQSVNLSFSGNIDFADDVDGDGVPEIFDCGDLPVFDTGTGTDGTPVTGTGSPEAEGACCYSGDLGPTCEYLNESQCPTETFLVDTECDPGNTCPCDFVDEWPCCHGGGCTPGLTECECNELGGTLAVGAADCGVGCP